MLAFQNIAKLGRRLHTVVLGLGVQLPFIGRKQNIHVSFALHFFAL